MLICCVHGMIRLDGTWRFGQALHEIEMVFYQILSSNAFTSQLPLPRYLLPSYGLPNINGWPFIFDKYVRS